MYAITIERSNKIDLSNGGSRKRQNQYLLNLLNVKKYLSTEIDICLYNDKYMAYKVKSLIEAFCTDSRWTIGVEEYVQNKYPALIIQQTGLYYHAS
jgi:hypothetical protein